MLPAVSPPGDNGDSHRVSFSVHRRPGHFRPPVARRCCLSPHMLMQLRPFRSRQSHPAQPFHAEPGQRARARGCRGGRFVGSDHTGSSSTMSPPVPPRAQAASRPVRGREAGRQELKQASRAAARAKMMATQIGAITRRTTMEAAAACAAGSSAAVSLLRVRGDVHRALPGRCLVRSECLAAIVCNGGAVLSTTVLIFVIVQLLGKECTLPAFSALQSRGG